jgi:hypothetical protein
MRGERGGCDEMRRGALRRFHCGVCGYGAAAVALSRVRSRRLEPGEAGELIVLCERADHRRFAAHSIRASDFDGVCQTGGFVVVPGHELGRAARVVEATEGYEVVRDDELSTAERAAWPGVRSSG